MRPDLEEENLYYRKALMHPEIGLIGRNYLKSRGIKLETVKFWEIGWSPFGCVPNNFDKNDQTEPWRKMWGRITFPIRDHNGRIISISGRLVLKLKKPKYDHYSFPSRKVLFGLFQNSMDILMNNRAIITEGQFDVISSWQNGLKITTSSFGAHCSLEHFAIVSRYTSNIDILYDEDNAGKNGMKLIEKFPTWGDLNVNLHSGIFPKKDDLDSWLKSNSVDDLFLLLNKNKNDLLKSRLHLIKNYN